MFNLDLVKISILFPTGNAKKVDIMLKFLLNYQPEVPTNNSAGLYLDLTLIQKSFQESKNATHM